MGCFNQEAIISLKWLKHIMKLHTVPINTKTLTGLNPPAGHQRELRQTPKQLELASAVRREQIKWKTAKSMCSEEGSSCERLSLRKPMNFQWFSFRVSTFFNDFHLFFLALSHLSPFHRPFSAQGSSKSLASSEPHGQRNCWRKSHYRFIKPVERHLIR